MTTTDITLEIGRCSTLHEALKICRNANEIAVLRMIGNGINGNIGIYQGKICGALVTTSTVMGRKALVDLLNGNSGFFQYAANAQHPALSEQALNISLDELITSEFVVSEIDQEATTDANLNAQPDKFSSASPTKEQSEIAAFVNEENQVGPGAACDTTRNHKKNNPVKSNKQAVVDSVSWGVLLIGTVCAGFYCVTQSIDKYSISKFIRTRHAPVEQQTISSAPTEPVATASSAPIQPKSTQQPVNEDLLYDYKGVLSPTLEAARGKTNLTAAQLNEIIQMDPDNVRARLRLVDMYSQSKDYNSARSVCSDGLQRTTLTAEDRRSLTSKMNSIPSTEDEEDDL